LILSNQSEKTLRISSKIRARITAISLGKSASMGKIGITCRQPFLGALEWVEKEIRRAQGGATGENSTSRDNNADKKGTADSSHAKTAKKDKR